MDFFKQWTICVCTTLIVSVIFSILTPKGKLSSFYKIIISLFIFISFLTPFVDSGFHIDGFDLPNIDIIDTESNRIYEQMIVDQVDDVLENNGVEGANISAVIGVNDDEIEVRSVTVAVADEYDIDTVHNMIFDELSINSKVIHIGG